MVSTKALITNRLKYFPNSVTYSIPKGYKATQLEYSENLKEYCVERDSKYLIIGSDVKKLVKQTIVGKNLIKKAFGVVVLLKLSTNPQGEEQFSNPIIIFNAFNAYANKGETLAEELIYENKALIMYKALFRIAEPANAELEALAYPITKVDNVNVIKTVANLQNAINEAENEGTSWQYISGTSPRPDNLMELPNKGNYVFANYNHKEAKTRIKIYINA
jgi:hypothetical protein